MVLGYCLCLRDNIMLQVHGHPRYRRTAAADISKMLAG